MIKEALGGELGTAHFIVGRGGAIKLKDQNHWVRMVAYESTALPRQKIDDLILEAIDASNTDLMYEGLENFGSV